MKIKETPWEKRNLGVKSSIEYYFELNDAQVDNDVLTSKIIYQVAHIPVGNVTILNKLLKNGFIFSELKMNLMVELKNYVLPRRFERFIDGVDYHVANDSEIKKIYLSMKGGVFSTDKVALDPFFNAELAGQRYAFWTQDEIKAGHAFAYVVTSGKEDIGFFVLKKLSERLGESFLAGLFNKDKDYGLGFTVLYFPLMEAKRMGLKKIITGVSSNNPDSLKMHLALGYQIKNMAYTLVKHV